MKKLKETMKRIATLGLAAMLLTNSFPAAAFAAEADGTEPAIVMDAEDLESSEEISEGETAGDEAEGTSDEEGKEISNEDKEEYPAFEESKSIDGVKVSVTADDGVFPEGATLSVTKVTFEQEKQAEKAVEDQRPDNQNVAVSYTYDIKVLDKDGNEIQPADSNRVRVSFKLEEVADSNLETNVYHITEKEDGEAENTADADSDELVAEKLPVETDDDTATAETDGFSLYTVEFTYNNLQYVLPGDSEVALSAILETVGLSGDVSAVSVSNETLFSAAKNDSGEWMVTAHKAFDTNEWMKVIINGVEYEITVTDDQNVSLQIDNDITEGEVGHYYVNMDLNSTDTLSITREDISNGKGTFKVYDEGGKDRIYNASSANSRTLVINVPTGHSVKVSGKIKTRPSKWGHYLSIYDGNSTSSNPLLSRKSSEDDWVDITECTSTGSALTLYFYNNPGQGAGGLDLSVTIIEPESQSITISNTEGGSVTSVINGKNVNEAVRDDVVTLTVTPAEGYLLQDLIVKDAQNNIIDIADCKWYSGWDGVDRKQVTFTMPASDVTVTPVFTNAKTATDGLYVNMPKSGKTTINIPAGVTSFKLYDDGGKDNKYSNGCNGEMVLTAPEGYRLQISGTSSLYDHSTAYNTYYSICNGTGESENNAITWRNQSGNYTLPATVSDGESLWIKLKTGFDTARSGLDLTVEVVDPNKQNDITISSINHGSVVSNQTSAKAGDTVTLNIAPDANYVLKSLIVTDDGGNSVAVEGLIEESSWASTWYSNSEASFTMPGAAVTVSAEFDLRDMRIPHTGSESATIPSGIESFKVYDNSGKDGSYEGLDNGTLLLTAPEGYAMHVTGYVRLYGISYIEDYLDIHDGNTTEATKLGQFRCTTGADRPTNKSVDVTSNANQILLHFVTNGSGYITDKGGVYLTITLVKLHTVSFAGGGGTGTMNSVYVGDGKDYTLPTHEFTAPNGKKFKEWAVKIGDASVEAKAAGDKITVTADTTVTAVWEDKTAINPSVSIEGWTYGDTANAPSVTGNDGNGTVTYEYKVKDAADSTYTNTVPTNAGEYTVRVTIGETDNYVGGTSTTNFTIAKKSVTISGLTASNKEYDGTATATVTGTATIDGKDGSDDVSVTVGTASFADANVGTAITVTFSGYSLTGDDANNYTLSAQPASVTADITKKAVTVTAKAQSVEVGGQIAMGTAKAELSGAVSGHTLDSVTLTGDTNAVTDNGTITPSAATIKDASGNDVTGNYDITYTNGVLTVTNVQVYISGVTASNKTYDGNTTATVTGTAVLKKVSDNTEVSGLTVSDITAAFANKNVGKDKTVTITEATLSDENNYTLNIEKSNEKLGLTANITAKPVTITGLSASDKVYDGTKTATTTGTAVIEGVLDVDRDDVSVSSDGNATFADANVGTGIAVTFSGYSLTGAAAGNYKLSAQPASDTADITKKAVTVTAKAQTVEVGGSIATGIAQATLSGTLSGHTLGSVTLTGDTSAVTTTGTITPSAATIKDASGNDVTGNYDITYTNGVLTVTNVQVYISGVTASNKTYDGNTTATVTGTAVLKKVSDNTEVSGLTVSDITASFADKNVGTGKVVTISAATLSDTTNYTLMLEKTNEKLGLKANITKKEVTLNWSNTEFTYDGSEKKPTATAGGLVSGDSCEVTVTGGQTNVGTNYTATATDLSNVNYKLPTTGLTQTFAIGKADIADGQFTAPTAKTDLKYDGTAKTLIDAGSVTGNIGTMQYALGADADTVPTDGWKTTLPTGKNAGTHYVWYRIIGDANHNDKAPIKIAVNIAKATGLEKTAYMTVEAQMGTNIETKVKLKQYLGDGVTLSGSTSGTTEGTITFSDISLSNDGELTFKTTSVSGGKGHIELTVSSSNYENYKLKIPVEIKAKTTQVNLEAPAYGAKSSVTGVEVKGLSEYTNDQAADSVKVVLDVTPEKKANVDNTVSTKIENALNVVFANVNVNDRESEYLDISVKKQIGDAAEQKVEDVGRVIEIAVYYKLTGKFNPVVIREHKGATTVFTALADRPTGGFVDGTFYVDTVNGVVYIYSELFSTYTIAYAKKASYTVTFDSQGGSAVSPYVVKSGGSIATLPETTRSGYTLDGWFTLATGGKQLTNVTAITADVTYYAHWTKNAGDGTGGGSGGSGGGNISGGGSGGGGSSSDTKTYCTVKFDANGGSAVDDKKVERGTAIGTLPTTTRDGYTFGGWYDGTVKWTADTIVSTDTTLKAEWTKNEEPEKEVRTLTADMVTLSFLAKAYTGKALKPKVVIKDGETVLTEGTNYTVSYKNNTDIGTATVTVEGIGNYKGTVKKTFKITAPAKGKTFTVNKCTYRITDAKKYTVSIIGTSVEGKLTIGKTVKIGGKAYKITGIAAKAFKNNKKLTKVVIGANVASIGKQAFYGCKNLKSIVIKTKKLKAKKIGSSSFKGIYVKVVVTVPKGMEEEYEKILKKKGLSTKAKIIS